MAIALGCWKKSHPLNVGDLKWMTIFPWYLFNLLRLAQREIKIPTMDLYQSPYGHGSKLATPKCHSVRRKNAKIYGRLDLSYSPIPVYIYILYIYIYSIYTCI
jgi:hypothetical protein